MAQATDFTAAFKDMFNAFPMNANPFEDAIKNSLALNEKLAGVALEAAEKTNDISNKWTKDTLAKLAVVSQTKAEPADYAKIISEFASASAEAAAENLAAYAEIAKKAQMDTVELVMAAGKDFSEEATNAVKKATDEVTKTAKKAAAK